MATTPVQIERPVRAEPQAVLPAALSAVRAFAGRSLVLWHLLSLDAPCVAVCWMLLFRSDAGRHGSIHSPVLCEMAALFLAVWIIYVLDRLLDARAGRECLQARHHFHWQARHSLCLLLAGSAILLAMLVAHLPAATRLHWPLLAVPLLAYAALVHMGKVARLPKTLVTAAFFAGAVMIPAWQEASEPWRLFALAMCFGGVCWLNGALIENWEAVPPVFTSRRRPAIRMGAVLLALAATLFAVQPSNVLAACIVSVALLLVLDRLRPRLDAVHLRALADAALLTPLFFLLPVR